MFGEVVVYRIFWILLFEHLFQMAFWVDVRSVWKPCLHFAAFFISCCFQVRTNQAILASDGQPRLAGLGARDSLRLEVTFISSIAYLVYIYSYHYINIYIYSFLSYIVWHNWDLTKAALCHFFAIIIQSIPHNMTTLTIWWQLSIPHNMTTLTIRWQLSIPSKGLKKTWYDNKPE